jgi:hypothetical protein
MVIRRREAGEADVKRLHGIEPPEFRLRVSEYEMPSKRSQYDLSARTSRSEHSDHSPPLVSASRIRPVDHALLAVD